MNSRHLLVFFLLFHALSFNTLLSLGKQDFVAFQNIDNSTHDNHGSSSSSGMSFGRSRS